MRKGRAVLGAWHCLRLAREQRRGRGGGAADAAGDGGASSGAGNHDRLPLEGIQLQMLSHGGRGPLLVLVHPRAHHQPESGRLCGRPAAPAGAFQWASGAEAGRRPRGQHGDPPHGRLGRAAGLPCRPVRRRRCRGADPLHPLASERLLRPRRGHGAAVADAHEAPGGRRRHRALRQQVLRGRAKRGAGHGPDAAPRLGGRCEEPLQAGHHEEDLQPQPTPCWVLRGLGQG
mmetsp:Transcript_76142/g.196168  ORF Transcript_76142/g.196168 Transcript_76142/m.196168 type:complete len:231 (-) Transcript_76142:1478-2170(-)